MDRRRFLKHAGATDAVLGASAFGLDYLLRPSPSSENPTTLMPMRRESTTAIVSSTSSAQSMQLASLQGRLFFDYNGNGVQDGEEPAVADAVVQLKDDTGKVIAESHSDSSGDYSLEDIRRRSYRLHVGADKRFRYMCRSGEQFSPIRQGYDITLDQNARIDIGLMEGFLTLPIDTTDYLLWSYVDLDHRIGYVRNFAGDRTRAVDSYVGIHSSEAHPGTSDQHQGVDYNMAVGRNVLAMAPGVVLNSEGGTEYARYVRIIHKAGDEMFVTDYGHNSKNLVKVGDAVKRGQIVALSGDNNGQRKTQPHVHASFWEIPEAYQGSTGDIVQYMFEVIPKVACPNGDQVPVVLDPYRDKVDSQGSRGYWTKENDPQYAITQDSHELS